MEKRRSSKTEIVGVELSRNRTETKSYYNLLRESQLTWQKGNKENPRKKPEEIEERNKEIAEMLKEVREEIEAGKLVVYALDECHLQGDDKHLHIINYLLSLSATLTLSSFEFCKMCNQFCVPTYNSFRLQKIHEK